jgi:hypothetical protein
MALFRKSNPEDALALLKARAVTLETRRAAAQVSLDEAVAKRQKHLLEGDLDGDDRAIARLESDVVATTSRVSGLVDAIGALQAQIGEAEHQIQVEKDQAERKVAAERLTDQVLRFEELLSPILTTMRAFADACEPLCALSYEAAQIREYVSKLASEIEIAASFVGPDLRLQVTMVANGERAAPKPMPEIIELAPVESISSATDPGEETQEWFGIRPMKWKGVDGTVHQTNRWEDVSLPTRLVARASQRNCLAPMTDATAC